MKQAIKRFLENRSRSERKLLAVWLIAVMGGIAYYGLVSPLYGRIARLEMNLPVLQAQLLEMQSPPPSGAPARAKNKPSGDLRSAVFQFLAGQQVTADVRSLTADRIEVRLPDMPSEKAIPLMERLREQTSTRIASISVKRNVNNGPVQVVAELEQLL